MRAPVKQLRRFITEDTFLHTDRGYKRLHCNHKTNYEILRTRRVRGTQVDYAVIMRQVKKELVVSLLSVQQCVSTSHLFVFVSLVIISIPARLGLI